VKNKNHIFCFSGSDNSWMNYSELPKIENAKRGP